MSGEWSSRLECRDRTGRGRYDHHLLSAAPVLVADPVSGSRYVAIYAVGVLIVGCAIGLVLRWTAMVTLVIGNR